VTTATMRAAVFADVGKLALAERAVPELRDPNDVALEIECCGICGTDLHILSDPPGHPASVGVILGHEFVGIVRDVGADVTTLRRGERVVVAANVSCGRCGWCRRGLANHCERFTTHGIFTDGGLAPRVVVPARSCFPIARDVPAHIAALAEPLSTVVNGARLADPFPGETAAVVGAGPIGLMFAALLTMAGASVVAVEPVEQRRELAQAMGAVKVIDPTSEDAAGLVRELTGGLGADIVVDAVGSQLPAALELVRKGGRVVLFGMNTEARAEVTQVSITRNELSILGAYVGRSEEVFPPAVRLLEQGRIDLSPLVTHRIELDQLPAAIDELRAGRAVKVEVQP
jgi:2-desacetyl-2-hydroxyethyl bacteriochlorophyllide A dehydrogenase